MSVFGEFDLFGLCVYGVVCGEVVFKVVVEDFQVDEVLDIFFSGEGEYFWLWVEKCGLNIEEVVCCFGCVVGVQQKNVSYVGLKDCQVLIW